MVNDLNKSYRYVILIFILIMALEMAFKVYFTGSIKKPLCIDSRIVYKIDKINKQNIETIYNCHQLKKVQFSEYFYDHILEFESRLMRLEVLFNQIKITNKFVIIIDTINKNDVEELPNGIRIGIDKIRSIRFERKLLQVALKNKYNIKNEIFLETLADFVIPDGTFQNLISQAWSESFKEFNYFYKTKKMNEIFSKIENILGSNFNSQIEAILKLKSLLTEAQDLMAAENFNNNLQNFGFYTKEELLKTNFDIIIESSQFKNFNEEFLGFSKDNLKLKIAVKNSEGMFLLPSRMKVPMNLEQRLTTKYRLLLSDKILMRPILESYINNSESLILMNVSSDFHKLNFKSLFKFGMQQFLSQNNQFEFIQIHLPSYKLKYKELTGIVNYFDFVKSTNLSSYKFATLGWERTEWLKDLNAFKPIAFYDVIQYFRVNN